MVIITINGCSSNNAFKNFNLDKKQELSINSLQSSKVKDSEKIDGIVSVIYLNKIYPKLFNDNEYFFVYFYLKTDNNLQYKLNGALPLKIKKLNQNNRFADLIDVKNNWNSYYLITFKKQDKNELKFIFENYPFVSDLLVFQKD